MPLMTAKQQVNSSSTAVSPVTRKYVTIIRRFLPMVDMKICYQATFGQCSSTTFQSCQLDTSGQLDPVFYPQRCSYLHVKQNPAVVSVLPADNAQIVSRQAVVESASVPPWRHNITNSTVALAIGELLQLNVDAYDVNDEDDVDIMFTVDSVAPASAMLGPRMCCSDDFSTCQPWPFQYTDQFDVNTTSCDNETNDAALAAVVSSCSVQCTRWALRSACRAGSHVHARSRQRNPIALGIWRSLGRRDAA